LISFSTGFVDMGFKGALKGIPAITHLLPPSKSKPPSTAGGFFENPIWYVLDPKLAQTNSVIIGVAR
jgi:hypothetical protein